MPNEQILVIPRANIEKFLQFRGFMPAGGVKPEDWLTHCQYEPRDRMEQDPTFKQLIPYILLRHQNRVFRYWRTKRAGESRLHHLYSIGVGGHIDEFDTNLFSQGAEVLQEAAMRELHEEVALASENEVKLNWIGWINDDDSEVGQVHLGLVYEAFLENPQVELREQALGRGEWKPIDELLDGVDYETWSLFVIEQYLQVLLP